MNKTLTALYNTKKLIECLKVFGWKWEDITNHPVTTGNCDGLHHQKSGGTLDKGFYQNAASACGHCYPQCGPARLDWDMEKQYITLTYTTDGVGAGCAVDNQNSNTIRSSKPIKFAKIFRMDNPEDISFFD